MIPNNKIKNKNKINLPIDNSSPSSIPIKQESNLKISSYSKPPPLTSLPSKSPISTQSIESKETTSSKKQRFMISKKLTMMMKSSKTLFSTSPSISHLETWMKHTKVSRTFKIQLFGKKWLSCASNVNVSMWPKYVLAI